MDLQQYISSEPGAQARLIRALSVPASLLSQWKNGDRRVPAERCPAIERETGGKVRCEDLRPDVPWDVLRMQAGGDVSQTNPSVVPAARSPVAINSVAVQGV